MGRRFGRTLFLGLVCMICSLLPLWSVPLEIGYVAHDGTGEQMRVLDRLFDLCSFHFSTITADDAVVSLLADRLELEKRLDLLRTNHEFVLSSDGNTTGAPTVRSDEDSGNGSEEPGRQLDVAWQKIQVSDSLGCAAAEGDRIVIKYLADARSVDRLLVASVRRMDAFLRMRIVQYDRTGGEGVLLFDRIGTSAQFTDLLPYALMGIAEQFTGNEVGAIEYSVSVPGAAISVSGEPADTFSPWLLVSPGTYRLDAAFPGFTDASAQIAVDSDTVVPVRLVLEQKTGPPLLVTGGYGDAAITIPETVSTMLPFVWEHQKTPFTLDAERVGYRTASLQVFEPAERFEFDLQPAWMVPETTILRAQADVYGALGRTLLLGALTVLCDSAGRFAADNRIALQPFLLVSGGMIAVSAFDTLSRLFAYYKKTQYSSR